MSTDAFLDRLDRVRRAARSLATVTAAQKNAGLSAIAAAIEGNVPRIVAANELGLARAKNGMEEGAADRLLNQQARVRSLADAVRELISLPGRGRAGARSTPLPMASRSVRCAYHSAWWEPFTAAPM